MANKVPIAVILMLAGAAALVLLGQDLFADSEDTQTQSMVFEWDYADNLPPVDYWEVEVKRVVAGYENTSPPERCDTQRVEVHDVFVGAKISIRVRGVNAAGTGPWSDWSLEQLGELPLPPEGLLD